MESMNENNNFQECLELFSTWAQEEKMYFVSQLLLDMNHYQLSHVETLLRPFLMRDFISQLHSRIAEKILLYLDPESLLEAEKVSSNWAQVISNGMIWKRLMQYQLLHDPFSRAIIQKYKLLHLFNLPYNLSDADSMPSQSHFFRNLYLSIHNVISKNLESNWLQGCCKSTHINCQSVGSKGVYCLQYDDQKIICGLRDNTIKVWNRSTNECVKILHGHFGSILCLQFDENILVSGSTDTVIRVWSLHNWESLNVIYHHSEAVLHLKFDKDIMVTCSKDKCIAVWHMMSPNEIHLKRVLVGHRAAVNVVDFDHKYIVSASGDRTIKVWDTNSCAFVRTLSGHKRGIACLQYWNGLIVSGSSDNTIRIWNVEMTSCLRVLKGHNELVRCVRFNDKRIVSGSYDGEIKVWDMRAALQSADPNSWCIQTFTQHKSRVIRLQFDDFQIVSCSHDDSIIIWDFSPPFEINTSL